MNTDAKEVFTAYFGDPGNLYLVFGLILVVMLGIVFVLLIMKASSERGRDKSDSDVMLVVGRGLFLLLFVTAIFTFI